MYRNYCIEGNQVLALFPVLLYSNGADVTEILAVSGDAQNVVSEDSETYHEWVEEWKDCYNKLSLNIASIRSVGKDLVDAEDISFNQKLLNGYRLLANTMLNARQYARDARRAARTKALH